MNLFKRDVHHYHIVEVDKSTKLPELTGDLKESLKTLSLLPAFQYILQRWRIKKAALENALKEGFKLNESELRYLQAGIYWAGEIERDIKALTADRSQARPASEDEMAAFKKMAESLSLIGNNSTPQG